MRYIISINSQIHIKIFLKSGIEIDPYKTYIKSYIKIWDIKRCARILLHWGDTSNISLLCQHSKLQFYVRISIICIVFNFKSPLRSWIHLERIFSFLEDLNLEKTTIFRWIFDRFIDIWRIIVNLCNCNNFKLFTKVFIRHEKNSIL
jgi:hypothetical protein